MEQKVKVEVSFRKFPEGDVIALFPKEKVDLSDGILSYMHIGQHSPASPELLKELKKASKKEYMPLLKELEKIGYEVVVEKRSKK